MENENLKPIEKLTPFTKMIMTIGTLPSSFYASMSYYESMVWLYEYLKNEVIPTVNNNAEAVEELQTAFITLKDWIEHYFDNLDLQEEVNKKLDEMAEDGTITNLIKDYIDPLFKDYKDALEQDISNYKSNIDNDIEAQNEDINSFKLLVNNQISDIDEKVDRATSGSPKGVYATLVALQTADPDHDYIYVVSDDGKWYYYDTSLSAWTAGGTYQAAEDSSTLEELDENFHYIIDIDKSTYHNDCFIHSASGTIKAASSTAIVAIIKVIPNTTYKVLAKNNDRFRIALSNIVYDGVDIISDVSVKVDDNSLHEYEVDTGNYNYLYFQGSNDGTLFDLSLLTNIDLTTKKLLNNENTTSKYEDKNIVIRNKELLLQYNEQTDYINNMVVTDYGRQVQVATSSNVFTSLRWEMKPNHSYLIITDGVRDRYRLAVSNENWNNNNIHSTPIENYDSSTEQINKYNTVLYNNKAGYKYAYLTLSGHIVTPYTEVYEINNDIKAFDEKINNKVLTVKDFGAVGDGETDDTTALEYAYKYCYENHIPVIFEEGTYIIRRSLPLRSNMEIYGLGNAILKKKTSATTRLTQQLNENGTTIYVASTSGFEVGDQITISAEATTYVAAKECTVGYITEINAGSGTITFVSAYDEIKHGAIKNHETGCYVTNSIALMRSWGMKYNAENVYIHDMTLNSNRVNGEFGEWLNDTIHIDSCTGTRHDIVYDKPARNLTCRNLTILNSPFDGISDQSYGGALIENCKISNCYMHGIHFGSDYSGASVMNNEIKTCVNGAGIFWCQNVGEVIVESNRIIQCNKGCSDYEYGTSAQNAIINGNVFDNITSYVFDFSRTTENFMGKIIISNNIIKNCNTTVANLLRKKHIILNSNIISNLTEAITNLFNIDQTEYLTFTSNILVANQTVSNIFNGSYTHLINSNNSWN